MTLGTRLISRSRRYAPYLLGLLLAAGLVAATSPEALSTPLRPAAAAGSRGVIGHLAFVSKQGNVDTVAVKGYGNTVAQHEIGPITKAPAGRRIAVSGFHASNDGTLVAWQESVVTKHGTPTAATPTLVLRSLRPSQLWTLRTAAYPLGFGGHDQLVVYAAHTSVLVLAPSPHLVRVPGAQFPLAVYPNGVVETRRLASPAGRKVTEQLRLSTFAGHHTTLHRYVMRPGDPRIPEQAFVSPDGKRLIVERGDHTDFGGIGPSSLVDEFSLHGTHSRKALGHYGTAKAAWRVGGVSFAWPDDEPWVIVERATKAGGAKTAIVAFQHHRWRKIVPRGIAVAGNPDGFVVAQPGRYVFDSDGLGFARVPTGDALMLHETVTKVLGIRASALAWVATPS